ncbi:unnamed protein product, partial [Closterium sp. NIES-54]
MPIHPSLPASISPLPQLPSHVSLPVLLSPLLLSSFHALSKCAPPSPSPPLPSFHSLHHTQVHANFSLFMPIHHFPCLCPHSLSASPHPPLPTPLPLPSFHSLHHTQVHTNFSLFMPIYDYLGGTWDPNSDALHEASRKARKEQPDFVFLAHGMTIPSVLHMPFFLPYFASKPFAITAQQILLLPVSVTLCLLYWAFAAAFPRSYTYLRGKRLESWGIPRLGFHKQINRLIEGAILKADKAGVQVFTLGALNKQPASLSPPPSPSLTYQLLPKLQNEALNGGGTAFLKSHPNLKLRLVHGNTLTAAVILQEISPDAHEVFLAGATSKLGRAIAIYLASKGTRVLMLTTSKDRFESIRSEARADKQQLLVQVKECKQAAHRRKWIVGKWLKSSSSSPFPRLSPAPTHLPTPHTPPHTPHPTHPSPQMLTTSKERFESIRSEAPAEKQHLLVQVMDCKQASHCREWIVGKWLTAKQQSHAPKGTFFHQFV